MHTTKLEFTKMDVERIMITLSMAVMEGFGFITLICGILGVKIF